MKLIDSLAFPKMVSVDTNRKMNVFVSNEWLQELNLFRIDYREIVAIFKHVFSEFPRSKEGGLAQERTLQLLTTQ